MAPSDKRKLELEVKVDDKATKPLKSVGDAADDTKGDLQELNAGLKKLDDKTAETTATIAKLRQEIARTGDLELIKDITKQEARLKALVRQRKLLLGDDDSPKKLTLPDIDVDRAGIGIAARLGPVIVKNLPAAMSGGGGVGAAIGAPIVAGLATWLSSAAVGAVLGGAAVGAVAGGVAIAARDSRVKAAGAALADSIGAQLEDAAAPFVPATLKAIDKVEAGFRSLDGDLKDIFGRSAGYVDPLTDAVVGFGRGAIAGFNDLVRGARPVVAMLREQLPELGDEIGDSLSKLAQHGPEAARALGMVLETAGAAIEITAQGLATASKIFQIADLAGAAMRGPQALAETAAGYHIAAKQAEDGTYDWSEALKGLGAEASTAAGEVKSLTESVNDIVEGNLSVAEATLAAQQAIVDGTKAIRENGRSTDENSQRYRDNQTELLRMANRFNELTVAMEKGGIGADAARDAHEGNRAALIKAARAAGYTREQAAALAAQWLKVPGNVSTTVKANTKQAQNALSTVRKTLDALDGKVANASVYISAYNKNAKGMSTGGPVTGPGPKGVDSVPAVLAPGEYVIPARDVDRLGGIAAVAAWHRGGADMQARDLMGAGRPAAMGGAPQVVEHRHTIVIEGTGVMRGFREVIRVAGPEATLGIRADVVR